jgi:hypothetical protein
MAILAPSRVLRSLRKTPGILNALVSGVDQAQAETLRDGADGWNVVFSVCHMRDYEIVFAERVRLMLEQETPVLPAMDNEALIRANDYAHQDLQKVLADLIARRRALMQRLSALSESQWARRGVHPEFGEGSLLETCANGAMHDIDHLEQIARTLDLTQTLI